MPIDGAIRQRRSARGRYERRNSSRLFERRSNEVTEAVKTPATATESVCSPASTDAEDGITSVESSTPPQPTTELPPESPRLQAQSARRRRRVERFEQIHEHH